MKINSWDIILSKEKTLAKPNAIIDGNTRNYSLLSKNFMNVILYIREREQSNTFDVPLVYLRDMLKLSNNKDYKVRLEASFTQLSSPIVLRDFTFKGKEISYTNVAFLDKPTIYKDGGKNRATITINEEFVAALELKCGFTILEFMKLLECSTIFGYEIAQMLLRYKNLPNKTNNGIGRITKSISELNEIFDTKYKYKSEMERKLEKGKKDISENLGLEYTYMWDDIDKKFIFLWEKKIVIDNCQFPKLRLRELAEWIFDHYKTKDSIDDKGKFLTSTIKKLKAGEWENAEKMYRGMLQRKYGLTPDTFYDHDTNKYIDFKEKK